MRIVLTGSSGRVGRAIFSALAGRHNVTGMDRSPFSTTHIVGDFADEALLRSAFEQADAVIHTAALHAPHVGMVPDAEFQRINVEGTHMVAQAATAAGVPRLVFTSTTALYGHAVSSGSCSFIDEATPPRPKSIYHRTKLEAERMLEAMAGPHLAVRVLRMSRSFPEPADVMAAYRLHRGVDIRDVADAHVLALTNAGDDFQRYIISATTPFSADDCDSLAEDAASVLRQRTPALAEAFARQGWTLPATIDRVYSPARAAGRLGWTSRFGFEEVLAQLDRRSLEVLPAGANISRKSE
ncbi:MULTISPECIES: NAD(P)-dependent oxidoreductase [unclassified Agrobacterium]|uniref:NAD-dependent epimerase/dehydratase family protein n=1 Tax=unclassified Agrobacterium TaxID=2632611 RepID=UPI002449C1DB|nr:MULTISPECIES: NAD(P)-dependent oxidoreductase [unclassified Agrobacterium]MDH0614000.1 NAD(P)-dependent oxidoreductase [Agrobacterium sp. GD03872]MDH0695705.1 NAD(P)-dependent oxidoreductase [Agrobacterium sp. GD03871]MDH1058607.1 NAD(P)-dependent oxidoreductase [Agrobacterium sp. GD03992]MDH2209451.1 NAD(P)-dependent oxidoreductase [Agrobacterium sp. GD03643]MDH2218855.1 NAD(P)-dependent oxidoreductase [Agrobacterium sp. GD03638]